MKDLEQQIKKFYLLTRNFPKDWRLKITIMWKIIKLHPHNNQILSIRKLKNPALYNDIRNN